MLEIDPEIFTYFVINSVQVMVGIVPKSRHTNMKQHKHVKGDVTLSYMLRVLEKELKVKIDNKIQHTDFSDESMTYNKNVIA